MLYISGTIHHDCMVQIYKMIISPSVFFQFFKILIFFWRGGEGGKGQEMT